MKLEFVLNRPTAVVRDGPHRVDVIRSRCRPTGPALWRNLHKLGRSRVLEKATGVRTEETPDNQHEEKAVNRELAQFAEAYHDVKGHPCTSKPASPIARAQQKNTANDCEELSDLDPDPIRRATVTEVSNKTADTHDQIKAGDQDYRERNLLTAHSLAYSLRSILVHRNLKAPRFALPGNSASLRAASHDRLTGVDSEHRLSSTAVFDEPTVKGSIAHHALLPQRLVRYPRSELHAATSQGTAVRSVS